MKSAHTMTALSDSSEFLFLRLKKRSKIVKNEHILENHDNESLVETILS